MVRFIYETKCAAGKIYQTKCAAGQIFGLNPDVCFVLLIWYVILFSHVTLATQN